MKNGLEICDNTWIIETGWGNDYATGCLRDYVYFKKYYKLVAIDLSKQQKLDADHRAIQKLNFTKILRKKLHKYSLSLKKRKNVLVFSKWTIKFLWFCFILI